MKGETAEVYPLPGLRAFQEGLETAARHVEAQARVLDCEGFPDSEARRVAQSVAIQLRRMAGCIRKLPPP